jgi:Uma2 family endonuclease
MATTTSGLMTFEEFEKLPEHAGKQELLEGELIELPPAKKRHNKVAKKIFLSLFDAIERGARERDPAVGEVYQDMGYRLSQTPGSWLVPDVSVTHPNQTGEDYYEGPPLLAVEVVSAANTPEQIARKVSLYLANGSDEVWVVYPNIQSVWIYRKGTYAVITGTLRTDLLPGLSINLGDIFAG